MGIQKLLPKKSNEHLFDAKYTSFHMFQTLRPHLLISTCNSGPSIKPEFKVFTARV
jgi:hypothetical protein